MQTFLRPATLLAFLVVTSTSCQAAATTYPEPRAIDEAAAQRIQASLAAMETEDNALRNSHPEIFAGSSPASPAFVGQPFVTVQDTALRLGQDRIRVRLAVAPHADGDAIPKAKLESFLTAYTKEIEARVHDEQAKAWNLTLPASGTRLEDTVANAMPLMALEQNSFFLPQLVRTSEASPGGLNFTTVSGLLFPLEKNRVLLDFAPLRQPELGEGEPMGHDGVALLRSRVTYSPTTVDRSVFAANFMGSAAAEANLTTKAVLYIAFADSANQMNRLRDAAFVNRIDVRPALEATYLRWLSSPLSDPLAAAQEVAYAALIAGDGPLADNNAGAFAVQAFGSFGLVQLLRGPPPEPASAPDASGPGLATAAAWTLAAVAVGASARWSWKRRQA